MYSLCCTEYMYIQAYAYTADGHYRTQEHYLCYYHKLVNLPVGFLCRREIKITQGKKKKEKKTMHTLLCPEYKKGKHIVMYNTSMKKRCCFSSFTRCPCAGVIVVTYTSL